MKIVIDAYIPYVEALSKIADVEVLTPNQITREAVRDADALLVRTRTRCNQSLLEGSKVRFVGTATIGRDHIDTPWCEANGIKAVNAPGCNAPAVAQYVFSSLMRIINRPLRRYTIGIVGVGNVGRIVERWARALEMKVLLCDPPRQRVEGGECWSSLAEIAEKADIITFHTPLTTEGPDASFHLANEAFFQSLRRAPIIINAARGPVVDTVAWIEAIKCGQAGEAIVDCWEGEPRINEDLLALASVATPHIAGYSRQGKMRASQMVVDSLCDHFSIPRLQLFDEALPSNVRSITPNVALKGYNPLDDDAILRSAPDTLEYLRDNYHLREELPEAFSN